MKSTAERFWAKVDMSGDCWEWLGCTNDSSHEGGYGRFQVSTGYGVMAHRFAYELSTGPIPDGMELDHLCRNRKCVNPAHLEPVTAYENNMRGNSFAAVNARKTHCPRGHLLSGSNLYEYPSGSRACRQCRRDQKAARRQKELCGV